MLRCFISFLLIPGAKAESVDSIRLILPAHPSKLVLKSSELLSRRISQRCEAKVLLSGKAQLTVRLAVAPGIGREGYAIAEDADSGIRIVGDDERGLLYGIGKFLRTSAYGPHGFTPSRWRGTSIPKREVRGIYFATHFHNFYHDAPVEDIRSYVEDLSLWGVNALTVWYDMHHFDGIEDPAAQVMLKRLRTILEAARGVGMSTGLMLVANEAYNNSPKELRAVGPGRGGFYNVELCPHKPGAKELLLKQFSQVFEAFSNVGVDYVTIWPYDQGSCGCELCRPWGSNGFLYIAEPISQLARGYFPKVKVALSTWYFDQTEWEGLARAFRQKPQWVDYIMAEPGSHSDNEFLEHPVPGDLPLIGFPEISMAGMYPWGGFGANPQPARFQREWNVVKNRFQGGFPYSEGIYEDLNKVIFAQYYWNPDTDGFDTTREYLAYEFSPSVVTEMMKVIGILEQNHHYRWWLGAPGDYNFPGTDRWWNPAKGIAVQKDPGAEEAFEIVRQVQAKLSPYVRKSWRWRIIYLRTLLDRELKQNEGHPTERAKEAFRELIDIYHSAHADTPVKPPYQ
jgi:hypothetical protein